MARLLLGGSLFLLSVLTLVLWLQATPDFDFAQRVPLPANLGLAKPGAGEAKGNEGTLIPGPGKPSSRSGSWPQFRGPHRKAIADGTPIAATWPEGGPKVVWKTKVGEGHAGAAVQNGRVYLLDYDETKKEDAVRCLSLDNGEEIWRFCYSEKIKRNHGMSRTVPAVTDKYVVTLGPKCHICCLASESGELVFRKDMVAEYGTRIPEWYAGQCPLIDQDRLILAPGGTCLMTAVDLATGDSIWQTPNPDGWQMSHSSILPMEVDGERIYIWCSLGGAVAVSAKTGELLLKLPEWKIKIANVPSPLDLGQGRVLLSGGYNAGCAAFQLHYAQEKLSAQPLFRCEAQVFGSDQQTPVLYNDSIYGVIPGGKLACLGLDGNRKWLNEEFNFGLGPYLLVDGKLLVLDDDHNKPGELCLFKLEASGVTRLAGAKIIEGHDAWAPIAFVDGQVILRDATTLFCLDLVGS